MKILFTKDQALILAKVVNNDNLTKVINDEVEGFLKSLGEAVSNPSGEKLEDIVKRMNDSFRIPLDIKIADQAPLTKPFLIPKTKISPTPKVKPAPKRPHAKPITVNGKTYASVRQAIMELGVSSDNVYYWQKRGVGPAEALEHILKVRKEGVMRVAGAKYPPVDHKGVRYKTFKAMCEAWGKDATTVRNRLDMGWTLENSLEKRVLSMEEVADRWRKSGCPSHQDTTFTDPFGMTFKSEKEACEYYKVKYDTYKRRLDEGKSVEYALTGKDGQADKIRRAKEARTDHEGTLYDSVQSMCKAWHIEYFLYQWRLDHGWDKKRALTTPAGAK